jgi:8-oxo-dGTP diphosphatase
MRRVLGRVMDAAGAASGADRARVVIVRRGRVAAIERFRHGMHYWLLPGGGVEEGETIAQAALREAAEELGVPVTLGSLRVLVHVEQRDGSWQRHWCFDASTEADDIAVVGGPEIGGPPEHGTYRAVWLDLDSIGSRDFWPSPPVRMVAANLGRWPAGMVEAWEPLS